MKDFWLNLFFPKFCLNCKKEGSFLCYDCFSLIEILNKTYCPYCHPAKPGKTCFSCSETKFLNGLYAATPCSDFIIKKIVSQFKNNYLKELSSVIASIITTHLYLCNISVNESFILSFSPCTLKEKKKIGFDPSEEMAKELSILLKIPLINQFSNKNVFLVKDIFEEKMDKLAEELKKKGAKKVFALTLTRD
ncbi:MAG: hypothetical protein PHN37_00465 [Candidatus Pacebacteria bacterium]|nr:hypothetical protein [Candidatus Paceibacterota bacterium]